MTELITRPNLPDPDAFYARLIAWHEGRDETESHRLNAKLVLILANHIGDEEVLAAAMSLAEGDPQDPGPARASCVPTDADKML